jgi:Cu/Zn superoxide dismutase
MRRITKAALSGFAGCALILGASQAANSDSANMTYLLTEQRIPGPDGVGDGGDFQAKPGPFDGAEGTLRVSQAPDDAATGFKLTVKGIDLAAAGQEFGAHLHTGPCVDKDYANPEATPPKPAGSLAGPHYNHDVAAHGKTLPTALVPQPPNPAEVSPDTEVWFNLIPNDHGNATDDTKVSFVPIDSTLLLGEMSIVIHVLPNNTEFGIPTADQPAGYAGARQACFKLLTPDWAP